MSGFFDSWLGREPVWLDGSGPEAGLVLGTRALLFRNIAGFTFPGQAASRDLETILAEVEGWSGAGHNNQDWDLLRLAELTDSQRKLLQEKQLVTARANTSLEHRGVLVGPAGDLSILVNDEDHLRLTAFRPGFDPQGAATAVAGLESSLEQNLGFAYQEALGYLTAWPGRVGTGLHLSALVHLPGLVLVDEIDKILNALHQLKFAVRGFAGKETAVRGCLFQITSLVTLGRDEEEIVNDFSYHLGKVLNHEKSARSQLHARDRLWLEDLVQRSHAILQAARLITAQETYDRLSHLRLGVDLAILPEISPAVLNRMVMGQQAAHLEHAAGQALAGNDRAAARAAFLRRELAAGGF